MNNRFNELIKTEIEFRQKVQATVENGWTTLDLGSLVNEVAQDLSGEARHILKNLLSALDLSVLGQLLDVALQRRYASLARFSKHLQQQQNKMSLNIKPASCDVCDSVLCMTPERRQQQRWRSCGLLTAGSSGCSRRSLR